MPLPIPPKGRLGVNPPPGGVPAPQAPVKTPAPQAPPAQSPATSGGPLRKTAPQDPAPPKPQAPAQRPDGLTEEEYAAGWRVDSATGKRYKSLPKQVIDSQGFSESHMDDLEDAFHGLDGVADKYLAHLRVAPSADELRQLKEQKARLRRLQNEKFALEQEAVAAELRVQSPKGTAAERRLRKKMQEEGGEDFEDSQWS